MQYTSNYNLNKPDITDYAKIQALNENADIIDAKLTEISGLQTEFTTHLDDDDVHATKTKQTKWDNASNDVLSGGRLSTEGKPITDWNLAVENGFYTSSTTSLNSPVATFCSGTVEIFNANFLKQTIRQVDQINNKTFTRVRQSGVWEEWKEVNKLPTPTNAVLAAGWTNSYAPNPLRYYKDSFGIVRLNGRVRRADGNSSRLITTLPVGYRPLIQRESQVVVNIYNSGYVDIQTNGNIEVWLEGTTNVTVNLDISFPTTIV